MILLLIYSDRVLEMLFDYISILGGLGILDQIVDRKYRAIIAEFIFGFHNISAKKLERAIIEGIVDFFTTEGSTPRFGRVLIYSFFSGFLFSIYSMMIVYPLFGVDFSPQQLFFPIRENLVENNGALILLGFFTLMAILSFPIDVWGFFVSSKIYRRNPSNLVFTFFGDLFISLIASIFLIFLMFVLAALSSNMMGAVAALEDVFRGQKFSRVMEYDYFSITLSIVFIPSLFSIFTSSIMFFGLRFTLFCAFVSFRAVLVLTDLNKYTVLFSRAHDFPFLSLGIFGCGMHFIGRIIL